MRSDSLLLVCFSLLVTQHVQAEAGEGSRYCKGGNVIALKQGEEFTLVNDVEPLKWCHAVSTDNDSSAKCCYNRKGSNEDCDKYKPRKNTECPEYALTVDSIDSGTCTLTIKRANENAAGLYKIYDQDQVLLQECSITVSADGGETLSGAMVGFIVALVPAVLLVVVAIFVWKRRDNTETTTTDVEVQNLLSTLPQNMKKALEKALKEGIIKKTESSDTGEVKVMLLDGSWKEVRTPADVEALSTVV